MSDDIEIPVLRNDGDTLEERMTENAYQNILPARYLVKDEDGNIVEEQEEVFERVAKNISVAEYVFAQNIDEEHAPGISFEEIESGDIWNRDFASEDDDDEATAKMSSWADKFQHHMEHLKFMPNTPTIINAGTEMQQLSACITGDTPIYTRSGLKLMRDIEEGDEVLTHTGEFKPVTAHWSNGEKDTLEVKRGTKHGDNYSVGATSDHEFLTEDGEWVELEDINSAKQPTASPNVDVPEQFDLTQYTSSMGKDKAVVEERGFVRVENSDDPRTARFDQQYSEVVASVENTETFAFLAGVYLAEGDVDGTDLRFTINSEDEELEDRIFESLEELFDVHVAVSESNHGNWKTITVSSPFISDLFVTQFGNGTTEKSVPEWVFATGKNYQKAVLNGLFTDAHEAQSHWKLTLANPTLAYEASLLAKSLDFEANFTLRAENELSQNDTSRVIISKDSEKSRMSNIVKRVGETKEVYDMEVEDNHSFVAGDFIVHNCFVNSPDDDLKDIGQTETEAKLIFQSGGGVGYDFGNLRPYGDPVGSTGGIASGPITFMQDYDQSCETIAQGGVRRGAQMGTMPVTHPDIIHFIHAKNKDVSLAHALSLNDPDDPTYTDFGKAIEEARELINEDGEVPKQLRNAVEGHLSNFNISVTITDDFMEALQNGEEYTLINPRTEQPHIATQYTKDMYEWFDMGGYVEVGEELSLPAEEIWTRVIRGAWENGEPGVMYIDTVNEEHSYDTEENPEYRMNTSNPCAEQNLMEYEACLHGNETLLTDDGIRKIEDFGTDKVTSHSGVSEISSVGKLIPQGEKETITVKLDGEIPIRCTPDHEFKTDKGWIEAKDLIEEDASVQWMKNNPLTTPVDMEDDDAWRAFSIGWMHGDGWMTENSLGISFNKEDGDFEIKEEVLEHYHDMFGSRKPLKDDGVSYQEQTDANYAFERADELGFNYARATERSFPDWFYRVSENEQLAFLRGLFTADAGIAGKNNQQVQYATSSYQLADEIQRILGSFGIQTRRYVTEFDDREDQIRVSITKESAREFMDYIGIGTSEKREQFNYAGDNYTDDEYLDVISIEENESAQVYDLNVPETNQFFANGALVHNCNLGHINLSTIVDENAYTWNEIEEVEDLAFDIEDFLEQAIDWDELDERIEVGTRFLDNVVTMSDFPIPEIEETVRKNRKIGLGIMGLAQLYIQLGVEYGSPEANEIAKQLMKYINHTSKRVSNRLAQERGCFENWEDSKYANPQENEEWMLKHVGLPKITEETPPFQIRNHNTTTVAPTGTTSMLGNTTGGCEPIYNVAYYKNVTDDVQGDEMLVEFDSLFLQTLKENDIDVDEVKKEAERLMENNEFDGVQDLELVPDEIASLFVTTEDLNSKEHASVMCALQDGVDSSISKTLNAPFDATIEDAKETFEYVYENGGKSVTFYRQGTRTKQVKTTENLQADEEDEMPVDWMDSDGDVIDAEGFADWFNRLTEDFNAEKMKDDDLARKPPKVGNAVRYEIETGYGDLLVTITEDKKGPVEVIANIGNSGGIVGSMTEALGKLCSESLQNGVPPERIVYQLQGIRSPEVAWDEGDTVHSIPDGIALALKRYSSESDNTNKNIGDDEMEIDHTTVVPENYQKGNGEVCKECGSVMQMIEGCETCPDCGYSKC